jgi:hypothetical protein
MYRTVECPNCFHQAQVDTDASSGTVKCLKCGESISIEEQATAAYGVGVQRCPHCGKDCAPDAVICIECGYDFQHRKKHKTRRQPYQATWREPLALPYRLTLFVFLSAASTAFVFVHHRYGWIGPAIVVPYLGLTLGTFRRMTLSKNPDGQVRLKVARWLCFIPRSLSTFNLRKFKNVVLECSVSRSEDDLTWGEGYMGGWYDDDFGVIFFGRLYSEAYTISIVPPGIGDKELIWRTRSEHRARQICDALCKIGGLHYG